MVGTPDDQHPRLMASFPLHCSSLILYRPTSLLRPAVRCQTVRYNRRVRSGRGFTAAELAAAGIRRKEALTLGIPYDHRRRNKSEEGVSLNTERLLAYKERLIVFPKNPKKPAKADSSVGSSAFFPRYPHCSTDPPSSQDLTASTTQDLSSVFPLPSGVKPEAPRAITAAELEFGAFRALRQARTHQRQAGVWKVRKQKKVGFPLSCCSDAGTLLFDVAHSALETFGRKRRKLPRRSEVANFVFMFVWLLCLCFLRRCMLQSITLSIQLGSLA